jgi:predicted acylesterase/phospholipase RssA
MGECLGPKRDYEASQFANVEMQCDVVMKGGVASGLVYPYAILELGRSYRFRSIGGTSAGAIAAALTAAAEYSRTFRNDPAGFIRLEKYAHELPGLLATFFQPAPQFAPTMRFLVAWKASIGVARVLWAAVMSFWLPLLVGAALLGGLIHLAGGGGAGVALGVAVGALAGLAAYIWWVLRALVKHDYGMCTGMPDNKMTEPALTAWLHAAIQDVAFGPKGRKAPLTFEDLEGAATGKDEDERKIKLRMITTNLSMRRPHTLPYQKRSASFDLGRAGRFFPKDVVDYLDKVCVPDRDYPNLRLVPRRLQLPVIVAARMSLSFPLLFCAVPVYMRDLETQRLLAANGTKADVELKRVWFIDGGLSSNFPIHLFDALLPSRPTFALSLDELPKGAEPEGDRIVITKAPDQGSGLPVAEVKGLLSYLIGLLEAAKDWQDNMLSGMPGQRERIAKVMLSKREGGLNLTMPPDVSDDVMGYGQQVGALFAGGTLKFEEHQWERALVAYEQLETALGGTHRTWFAKKFGRDLASYAPTAPNHAKLTVLEREAIVKRLAAFARLKTRFDKPIGDKDDKMPRPVGRLRIGPDI